MGLSVSCAEELVARLSPHSGQIRSALEYLASPDTSAERPRRSRVSTQEEREDDLLPQLTPVPGTELRLTPYPARSFPPGASPQEITQHSLDSTYTLNSMISQYSRSVTLPLQLCLQCRNIVLSKLGDFSTTSTVNVDFTFFEWLSKMVIT